MQYQKDIKDNIKNLIDLGILSEASDLIQQYQDIVAVDIEIYSMKAVIAILENRFADAETILLQGLKVDNNNFDLLYNLAYVYEAQEKNQKAYSLYLKLSGFGNIGEYRDLVLEAIQRLEEFAFDDHEGVDPKKKIVFFVKQGLDSFLGDIINALSEEYELKKIIVTNLSQIDQEMQWADICWFEWCDELVVYGSKSILAKERHIVCRLHRYEAFTDYPKQVIWENVNILIIVTDHLKSLLTSAIPDISRQTKIVTIQNGVDLNRYEMVDRQKGFKLAYVGYIHSRKNPALVLQIIYEMVKIDKRYKLFVAGQFQEPLIELYWNYQIKKMGLEDNITFEGWQKDVCKWLKDKNYILSGSIHESFGYGIAEAMAVGVKPVIHDFFFAEEVWSKEFLFNGIDEAVKMILSDKYSSSDYRNFIETNYSLEKQVKLIKSTLEDFKLRENNKTNTAEKKTGQVAETFDYAAYWNHRLNNKFDIEGVGYIGLGKIYNKYMYQIRFDILNYLVGSFFPKGLRKKQVLELGPGIGLFTDYFYKQKANYKAIDIAEKSVKELKGRYKNYTFTQGDLSNPALFQSNEYDLVFAADVLLHLTDEEKYKIAINNIARSLKDTGYAILFDPITVVNTSSPSPHVVIRDIEYIKKVCTENGLEVVDMLPCSFFMNFPFDRELFADNERVGNIFSIIQKYFGSAENSDKDKEIVAQCLATFEKLCLIKFDLGLSEKVIILKKAVNEYEAKLAINKVWDIKSVQKEFSIAQKRISGFMHNSDIVELDKLLYGLIVTDPDQDAITPYYLRQSNETFIPFNTAYVDNYDFQCGYRILIGKKEKVTSSLEIIEFIVENAEKRKLLFLNIWHDIAQGKVNLPSYLLSDRNSSFISEAMAKVLDINVNYVNNIGGFILDEEIKRDVKKNSIVYNWERGIPATQFLPARGLLMIIERYIFAGTQIKAGDIILEAASGFGYGAAYMSRFCDHVYALDIAQDNIDFAKSSYQLPNVIWQNGDVTQLPYEDHYFDVYISFETMEHLPLDIVELYFTEAVRVIKKGGTMVISTPNRDMRMHVNNPFHIKEYSFPEFDTILRKYFSTVDYFSVVNYKVLKGFKDKAFDMLAVCIK